MPLATGTNPWDLTGSLTYYFDERQRPKKITFRGWTGDATHLTQLLTSRYRFEPNGLNSGIYLAKRRTQTTGALILKQPPVVRASEPNYQTAVYLELNNPAWFAEITDETKSVLGDSGWGKSP